MIAFIDMGMSELLVIGIVALIIVGPKDLPGMFRTVGRFTARVRAMSREFTNAMEQAADESGVKDIQKGLNSVSNPAQFGLDKVNEDLKSSLDWHPDDRDNSILPPKPEMDDERRALAKKISDKSAQAALQRQELEKSNSENATGEEDTKDLK